VFLVFLILEFLVDLVASVILEFVLEFTRALNADRSQRSAALVWLVLLGLCGAALSGAIVPDRVLRPGPFPGVSAFVVPPALGVVMHVWGTWRATIRPSRTWPHGTVVQDLGSAWRRAGLRHSRSSLKCVACET